MVHLAIPHTWSLNVGYLLVPDKMHIVPRLRPEITFHFMALIFYIFKSHIGAVLAAAIG